MLEILSIISKFIIQWCVIMFILCLVGSVGFAVWGGVKHDISRREEYQTVSRICYSRGMIPVSTDAGYRCVLISSLEKVN